MYFFLKEKKEDWPFFLLSITIEKKGIRLCCAWLVGCVLESCARIKLCVVLLFKGFDIGDRMIEKWRNTIKGNRPNSQASFNRLKNTQQCVYVYVHKHTISSIQSNRFM